MRMNTDMSAGVQLSRQSRNRGLAGLAAKHQRDKQILIDYRTDIKLFNLNKGY